MQEFAQCYYFQYYHTVQDCLATTFSLKNEAELADRNVSLSQFKFAKINPRILQTYCVT